MATLTDFIGETVSTSLEQIYVWHNTGRNGDGFDNGCCCCFQLGSYTTVEVELWGAGGNGAGACCCMWPYCEATAGSYSRKRIDVSSYSYLTLCSAGTGVGSCCYRGCCGATGYPSFVLGDGSATLACAPGGLGGRTLCFYKSFNCFGNCINAGCHRQGTLNSTICQPMYRGTSFTNQWCAQDWWESPIGAPKFAQNTRMGNNYCQSDWTRMGCCRQGNVWPGGGGTSGSSCGGPCCWGGWGAGGLVILTAYE